MTDDLFQQCRRIADQTDNIQCTGPTIHVHTSNDDHPDGIECQVVQTEVDRVRDHDFAALVTKFDTPVTADVRGERVTRETGEILVIIPGTTGSMRQRDLYLANLRPAQQIAHVGTITNISVTDSTPAPADADGDGDV